MINKQGSLGLLTIIAIPARLANEPLGTNKALGTRLKGAGLWQELGRNLPFVLLTVQKQGDACVICGAPGQGRGEHIAIVFHIIHLGITVASKCNQTVQQITALVCRTGHVHRQLLAIKRAVLGPDLAALLFLR